MTDTLEPGGWFVIDDQFLPRAAYGNLGSASITPCGSGRGRRKTVLGATLSLESI
jgi:hypothetical protein